MSIERKRLDSVDHFRGLTIILMVVANYLADIRTVPGWLKHATDAGLTFVDVIAPAFLVAIGLTYRVSYERRVERDGTRAAVGHFVRRWLALIGIGAIISVGEGLTGATGRVSDWGVLQAIGVAGLLTLPLIRRATWVRLCAGVLVLLVYQVGFSLVFADNVLSSPHGGLWGSLSWAAVLMMSSAFGDLLSPNDKAAGESDDGPPAGAYRRMRTGLIGSVGFIVAGLLLSLILPISKPGVSASYVLVSIGASASFFWAISVAHTWFRFRVPVLAWWGRNPIVLYGLHYILLGLIVLPGVDWWHAGAPVWLVALQLVSLLGVLTMVAWWLRRRHVTLSL